MQPASNPEGGRFPSCPAFAIFFQNLANTFFLGAAVVHDDALSPATRERRILICVAVMPQTAQQRFHYGPATQLSTAQNRNLCLRVHEISSFIPVLASGGASPGRRS